VVVVVVVDVHASVPDVFHVWQHSTDAAASCDDPKLDLSLIRPSPHLV
jgi:hypothetical protein